MTLLETLLVFIVITLGMALVVFAYESQVKKLRPKIIQWLQDGFITHNSSERSFIVWKDLPKDSWKMVVGISGGMLVITFGAILITEVDSIIGIAFGLATDGLFAFQVLSGKYYGFFVINSNGIEIRNVNRKGVATTNMVQWDSILSVKSNPDSNTKIEEILLSYDGKKTLTFGAYLMNFNHFCKALIDNVPEERFPILTTLALIRERSNKSSNEPKIIPM
jgi:hypothetical protein